MRRTGVPTRDEEESWGEEAVAEGAEEMGCEVVTHGDGCRGGLIVLEGIIK